MNLLELRNGIVHAEGAGGMDYTLCGVTAENILEDIRKYPDKLHVPETETEPYMAYTDEKVS